MKVFGIAGHSGMGKTTLLERLVPELTTRGLVVSLIKHSHKAISITAALTASGTADELTETPYRLTTPPRGQPSAWAVEICAPRHCTWASR